MDDSEALRKRSAPFELKHQSKLFEPKEGVHDPVILFHKGRIVNSLDISNGFEKSLEVIPLVEERLRWHVATSPEISSAWNTFHREKRLGKAFSSPSLWPSREREKGLRRDLQQAGRAH